MSKNECNKLKFQGHEKNSNCQSLFSFTTESCVCVQSSRMHKNMNVESTIEKSQKIMREKEVQKNEHRQRQEE